MNKQVLLFFVVAGTTALCSMIHSSGTTNQTNAMSTYEAAQRRDPNNPGGPMMMQTAPIAPTVNSTTILYSNQETLNHLLEQGKTISTQHFVHPQVAQKQQELIKAAYKSGTNDAATQAARQLQRIIGDMGTEVKNNQVQLMPNPPTIAPVMKAQ